MEGRVLLFLSQQSPDLQLISSVIEVDAGVVMLEFMAWHITKAKR